MASRMPFPSESRTPPRSRRRRLALAFSLSLCGAHSVSSADDHYVCVAGGSDPTSNQVSLERNVVFFRETIQRIPSRPRTMHLLFADGTLPRRDVQFVGEQQSAPEAAVWLRRLFGDGDETTYRYRDQDLPSTLLPWATRQSARKAFLVERLKQLASELSAGDRLILYVTTHGGPADSGSSYSYEGYEEAYESSYRQGPGTGNRFDTTISLWNDESISMSELNDLLDRFSADVPVVLLMTQCFAGGFAETVFLQGDRRSGVAVDRPRCGFFAALPGLPASGCTPEIDEATYQDYSTYFWAALGGVSRTGRHVANADVNGDGRVALAEAHAYAMLNAESIDVPLMTSDVMLRRFSEFGIAEEDEEQPEPGLLQRLFGKGSGDETQDAPLNRLVSPAVTLAELIDLAEPARAATLEGLADGLGFDKAKSVADLQSRVRRWGRKSRKAEESLEVALAGRSASARDIREAVTEHWPELHEGPLHPFVMQAVAEGWAELPPFIESLPQAGGLAQRAPQTVRLREAADKASRRHARGRRLLRTAQSVILLENLAQVASGPQRKAIDRVLQLEQQNAVKRLHQSWLASVFGAATRKADRRLRSAFLYRTDVAKPRLSIKPWR